MAEVSDNNHTSSATTIRSSCRQRVLRLTSVMLQVVLSLFFVVSALGKMLSVDIFEVYVFSFGLMPLGMSMVLARVVILVELLLGVLLIVGYKPRFALLGLIMLTIIFTLFLCYALLIGRYDSCHCLGELLPLSPQWSLLKNAVLIVLILILMRFYYQSGMRFYWAIVIGVFLSVGVFSLSMPDNWLYGESSEEYDRTMFASLIADDGALHDAAVCQGRRVVVLATEGCPYCRKTMQKLQVIAQRHDLSNDLFVVVLPDNASIHSAVHDDIPLLRCRQYRIPNNTFFRLTYGQFPIVLLLKDGEEQASYHYRNIDEESIAVFLLGNK